MKYKVSYSDGITEEHTDTSLYEFQHLRNGAQQSEEEVLRLGDLLVCHCTDPNCIQSNNCTGIHELVLVTAIKRIE